MVLESAPDADREFRLERAETMRARLRWLWGAALGVWVVSFAAFDLASFASRAQAAVVRVPECALALALWLWLRRPRDLRTLELVTVIAWCGVAGLSAYGLSLLPPDRLPFKTASFSLSVLVVCPLAALRWKPTAAIGVTTAAALSTLLLRGEGSLFMAVMTVVGFAYVVLVASAAARERLERKELASRLALAAAHQKLQRDDEARRRLFINLSHDLRTPLAVVEGEAALLRSAVRSDDEAQALARIASSARAMTDLAEQLLDLARLEAGQITHKPSACDVGRVAREVSALLDPPAGRATPRVVAAPAVDGAVVARVDPRHLERILTNLVANGLRHARSKVTIAARGLGDRIIVDVVDDGPGVPEERREAIFQRFVSFDSDGSTTSGIGLPLARELALTNDGSLELLAPDRAPDVHATTFRLTLPATDEPAADADRRRETATANGAPRPSTAATATATATANDAAARRRLLVVEDNADMTALLERVLGRRFDVEHASSVADALSRLESTRADAVLSDVLLPDGTGYEILAAVRARRELEAMPFVLLSALGEAEERVRGLDAGADDYLAKPFSPEELERRILAAIERAEARKRALDAQRDALLMEIHDGVSASLSRAAMLLVDRSAGGDGASTEAIRGVIAEGLDEVRSIAKLLAPRASSFGLLCAEIRRAMAEACRAAAIELDFEASGADDAPLEAPIAHALRRVAREATTNVLKHAGARRLRCRVSVAEDTVVLRVEDDGRGLPEADGGGQGLGIMRRRAVRVGGTVEIGDRPGGGAFVELRVPRAAATRARTPAA